MSVECVIPSKHHRVVLGQKGHHVQEITRTHNVNIKFPERNNEGETSEQFVWFGSEDGESLLILSYSKAFPWYRTELCLNISDSSPLTVWNRSSSVLIFVSVGCPVDVCLSICPSVVSRCTPTTLQ